MEHPLYAAYRAIRTRLTGGAYPWGARAYPGQAPPKAPRPYVVFSFKSGRRWSAARASIATYAIDIQCAADSYDDALNAAAQVSTLFDDQGTQDGALFPLDGGAHWTICTSTETDSIQHIHNVEGAAQVYVCGATVEMRLEQK